MLSGVAVDYWWMSCREIDVRSVGLPSQSMKRIWLGPWLRSGELKMPGTDLGEDCKLEPLDKTKERTTTKTTKKQLDNAYEEMKANYTKFKADHAGIVDNYEDALAKADLPVAHAQKTLNHWNKRKDSQSMERTDLGCQSSEYILVEEESIILQKVSKAANDLETATKAKQAMVTKIAYCKAANQEWEEAFKGMMKRQKDTENLGPADVIDGRLFNGPVVGRLNGLPEAVTRLGEPILCNVIPGAMERQYIEVTEWLPA